MSKKLIVGAPLYRLELRSFVALCIAPCTLHVTLDKLHGVGHDVTQGFALDERARNTLSK